MWAPPGCVLGSGLGCHYGEVSHAGLRVSSSWLAPLAAEDSLCLLSFSTYCYIVWLKLMFIVAAYQ